MTTWGTPPGSTVQPWYWWALAATVATLYTTTHSYILLVQVVTGIPQGLAAPLSRGTGTDPPVARLCGVPAMASSP